MIPETVFPGVDVPTTRVQQVIARGREEVRNIERKNAEAAARRHADAITQARASLANAINGTLGFVVSPNEVVIEEFGEKCNDGYRCIRATIDIDGMRFSVGTPTAGYDYSEKWGLLLERRCERCEQPMWVRVNNAVKLYQIEEEGQGPSEHNYGCLQQFDEDGDPTTDREGRPFTPKEPPPPPAPDPLEAHRDATNRYKNIVKLRRTLQQGRGLMKAAAIGRLIETVNPLTSTPDKPKNHSANSAEAVVESDPEYAEFCRSLTNVVIEEIAAREALAAARLRAGIPPRDYPEPEEW